MKRLKFIACVGVFGTASVFLGLGWIDSTQWMTVALTALSIFSATHAATDMAAIIKNGTKSSQGQGK